MLNRLVLKFTEVHAQHQFKQQDQLLVGQVLFQGLAVLQQQYLVWER